MEQLFSCLLLGGAVGLLSSFLGIGGGIVIVPLLPVIAGISTKEAVATSLLTVLFVTAKNVYGFQKRGLVPWASGGSIGLGAALATFTASFFISYVEEKYLIYLLLVVIVGVGSRLILRRKTSTGVTETNKKFNAQAFAAGLACGTLVGFTGIGGGVLYGPILLGLALVKDEEMSPGSNLAMMFSSVFAVLGFIINADKIAPLKWGYIHVDLALMIFASAFLVSQWGHSRQENLSPLQRKALLVVVLTIVFAKTLHRAIGL